MAARSRLRALAREQGGGLAVFWALGMFGLLAFLAIVIDGGFVAAERRQLQNAADAAALAGAQQLLADPSLAAADAQQWAAKNVGDLLRNEAIVSGSGLVVTVSRRSRGLFTGKLSLGRPEVAASASAAIVTKALPGPGVAPLAIGRSAFLNQEVQAGQPVTLVFAPPGSNAALLRISDGGANALREAAIFGSAGPLESIEQTETGQNVGPLMQGLATRVAAAIAAGCFTYEQVVADAGTPAWPCGPLQAADADPGGVQATSVLLIPVMVEDLTEIEGLHTVHVHQTASGLYLVAYFWLDAEATFADPLQGAWGCAGGPIGQCELRGRFLFGVSSALGQILPGDALIPYDAEGAVHVIQLVN